MEKPPSRKRYEISPWLVTYCSQTWPPWRTLFAPTSTPVNLGWPPRRLLILWGRSANGSLLALTVSTGQPSGGHKERVARPIPHSRKPRSERIQDQAQHNFLRIGSDSNCDYCVNQGRPGVYARTTPHPVGVRYLRPLLNRRPYGEFLHWRPSLQRDQAGATAYEIRHAEGYLPNRQAMNQEQPRC